MLRKYFCVTKSIFFIKCVKRKIIILYENYIYFTMCLILYFVIIIFAYNAFYFRLVFVKLISYILHNFFNLYNRIIINFVFKNDILNILIFRRLIRLIKNVYVNFLKALFVNLTSY